MAKITTNINTGDLQKATLNTQTFEYSGTNIFVLSNVINNILQVIVNTTSLHPIAYEYTIPNTVIVLNELYAGDTITIVYNYLEEVIEIPNLQSVTAGSYSSTVTATTTFTVTIGTTQANNNYKVVVSPSNALSAVMFYINNRTITTFNVVFVTALTGVVAFDWILKS